jgi:spore maturation protein CgeB
MRFLIVNTDYGAFLRQLYSQHSTLETAPYKEQMRARTESLFGVADFYSRNLRRLGHEACDVYANNEFMQRAWAREHGLPAEEARPSERVTYQMLKRARGVAANTPLRHLKPVLRPLLHVLDSQQAWLYDILSAQISHYKPDVLLNQNIGLASQFFQEAKPYTRLLVGQHASVVPKGQDLSVYDLMISSLPNLVDYFAQQGVPSKLHRLGFEPAVLQRLGEVKKSRLVSFVGSVFPAHASRRQWLEYVCQRTGVEVWGQANGLPQDSSVINCHQGTAWGLEMYRILRGSHMTLNHHIDVAENYANNMRLYEATGVGTLLVTDWKENLHEMFDPGSEVVAYRSPQECVELIEHYANHGDEREAIARRGQQRTLRDHTYYERMQELVDIVGRHL